MASQNNDEDTLSRAIHGDETSLTVLLVQHRPRLFSFLNQRLPADLKGSVGPEDLMQSTFIKVFQNIRSFIPDGDDSFFRWMITIARRQLQDAIDRERAKKRGGKNYQVHPVGDVNEASVQNLLSAVSQGGPSPNSVVALDEAGDLLMAAMAGLTEDHRLVLQYRYLEGLSVAETSERLNKSENNVRQLTSRAIKALRLAMASASKFL